MVRLTEEIKSDIEDIFNDTSFNGECEKLIEFIYLLADNQFKEERLIEIRNTLTFDQPKKESDIKNYDNLRIIYEYSKLK